MNRDMNPESVICFDAEFSDNQQILELAILDIDGNTLFHRYFRPEGEYTWRKTMAIHHITPAMVRHQPPFRRLLPDIQAIIDGAEYIIGGAIGNDIGHLSYWGVAGLDEKPAFDIREMHWMMDGRDAGLSHDSMPGVHKIAAGVGIEFDEAGMHSALEDTRVTLAVFQHYLEKFSRRYPVEGGESRAAQLRRCHGALLQCQRDYLRESSAGYLTLLERDRGVFLKANARMPEGNDSVIAVIAVEDRFKAEYDVRTRFSTRKISSRPQIYQLRPSDIDWFKSYANRYSEEESPEYREKYRSRSLQLI